MSNILQSMYVHTLKRPPEAKKKKRKRKQLKKTPHPKQTAKKQKAKRKKEKSKYRNTKPIQWFIQWPATRFFPQDVLAPPTILSRAPLDPTSTKIGVSPNRTSEDPYSLGWFTSHSDFVSFFFFCFLFFFVLCDFGVGFFVLFCLVIFFLLLFPF
ncbi:hypothetical protein F9C07_1732647 [Aspergillus flavus]|uniref:Uncharacterized protein n=1 Tax=Aspergillus flavus (strain ATCC 200026 / FGSC A1120 / IAM 13836 / NRRL 3357 / JCM 12722 / SRRC 167) TaxID=332952 RepID=A0A7U2N142_ASPFN|nr:hypothetical protein F9C07_1732647 [Aspergillus flavus]